MMRGEVSPDNYLTVVYALTVEHVSCIMSDLSNMFSKSILRHVTGDVLELSFYNLSASIMSE